MNAWSWLDVFGCFATVVVILGFSAAKWEGNDSLLDALAIALSVIAIFVTGIPHTFAWIACLLLLSTNFIPSQFTQQVQNDYVRVTQSIGILITAVSGAVFIFNRNNVTSIIFCLSIVTAFCYILYGLDSSKNRAL